VLRGQRVAALIMAGGLHDDPRDIGALAEALARFTESTGSNVTVIGQDRLGVATVGIGNHSGAKALAEALVAEAPGGSPSCAVHRATSPDANASRVSSRGGRGRSGGAGAGRSTATAGYDAMREVIDSGELPDVVFAVTDVMAVGALAAARDAGVAVPDDVKVAGFDDIPTLRDIVPALTTVRVPLEELGVLAVQLVMDRPTTPPPNRGADARRPEGVHRRLRPDLAAHRRRVRRPAMIP
jgi:LacI family transcriptional regulator